MKTNAHVTPRQLWMKLSDEQKFRRIEKTIDSFRRVVLDLIKQNDAHGCFGEFQLQAIILEAIKTHRKLRSAGWRIEARIAKKVRAQKKAAKR